MLGFGLGLKANIFASALKPTALALPPKASALALGLSYKSGPCCAICDFFNGCL